MAAKLLFASSVWKSSLGITVSTCDANQVGITCDANQADITVSTDDPNQVLKFSLDAEEVEHRGSHCLDGSAPKYYHTPGKTDKWIINHHAPGGMCLTEKDCYSRLPLHNDGPNRGMNTAMKSFAHDGHHSLFVPYCDFGMFLSDRPDPVVYKGQKLYFQGARIMKHVIDTLSKNYTMKEVLMMGGSGGGHSILVGAEFFHSIMPSTVKKFGVASVNGWYSTESPESYRYMFGEMNIGNNMNKACMRRMGKSNAYLCAQPIHVYDYNHVNMFVTQALDWTIDHHEPAVYDARKSCFTEYHCDDHSLELLNGHLHNLTSFFKHSRHYNAQGQGVFLSTCTSHNFYQLRFSKLKNGNDTLAGALVRWWNSLNSTWYWPCDLGSGKGLQCEGSCWLLPT